MASSGREARQFFKQCENLGVIVELRNNGHMKLICPNGYVYWAGHSVSDHRALKNIKARLRRDGGIQFPK